VVEKLLISKVFCTKIASFQIALNLKELCRLSGVCCSRVLWLILIGSYFFGSQPEKRKKNIKKSVALRFSHDSFDLPSQLACGRC
jgi:hypothetical protein